mgnify:CR=1 FL=1
MELKDSGNRRKFESGAVRDICDGKGRCDLLPMDVVAHYLGDDIFWNIKSFQESGNPEYLYRIISIAVTRFWKSDGYSMLLDVAKHFEDGARKYGDNNWRKGIPVHCYIDSAIRHYLKHKRGDEDEPHDRAFVWNIMCAIWTCGHRPELNEYAVVNSDRKPIDNIDVRGVFMEKTMNQGFEELLKNETPASTALAYDEDDTILKV